MIILRRILLAFLMLPFLLTGAALPSKAETQPVVSKGQTIFVPVYSQLYFGDTIKGGQKELDRRRMRLSSTVVIHNVDPVHPIQVVSAVYFNHAGERLGQFLPQPITLGPLETTNFFIQKSDKLGGVGNKFIISWRSDVSVNPPSIENIMVNAGGTSALAVISVGREVVCARTPCLNGSP